MDPSLIKVFIEEYVAEINRLTSGATEAQAHKERELAKVIKDQNTLADALLAGTPPDRIKDRLAQLETAPKAVGSGARKASAPFKKTAHPGMDVVYCKRIALMAAAHKEPGHSTRGR